MANYSPELILRCVGQGEGWKYKLVLIFKVEGHVNAGQLLGDLEHRANALLGTWDVLSQETLSFTVKA